MADSNTANLISFYTEDKTEGRDIISDSATLSIDITDLINMLGNRAICLTVEFGYNDEISEDQPCGFLKYICPNEDNTRFVFSDTKKSFIPSTSSIELNLSEDVMLSIPEYMYKIPARITCDVHMGTVTNPLEIIVSKDLRPAQEWASGLIFAMLYANLFIFAEDAEIEGDNVVKFTGRKNTFLKDRSNIKASIYNIPVNYSPVKTGWIFDNEDILNNLTSYESNSESFYDVIYSTKEEPVVLTDMQYFNQDKKVTIFTEVFKPSSPLIFFVGMDARETRRLYDMFALQNEHGDVAFKPSSASDFDIIENPVIRYAILDKNNEMYPDFESVDETFNDINEVLPWIDASKFSDPQYEFIPYVNPTCEARVDRPRSIGDKLHLSFHGDFFNDKFGENSTVEGNQLRIQYRYRPKDSEPDDWNIDWTTIPMINEYDGEVTDDDYNFIIGTNSYRSPKPYVITKDGGFNYKDSYIFQVRVQDGYFPELINDASKRVLGEEVVVLSEYITEIDVPPGIPVFDYNENDFRFNVPVYMYSQDDYSLAKLDYIVEQGTEDILDSANSKIGQWFYRKWSSGVAECWGKASVETDLSSPWGSTGLYVNTLKHGKIDYPFEFVEPPIENINMITSGITTVNDDGTINTANSNAIWHYTQTNGGNSKSQTGEYIALRPSSSSTKQIITAYYDVRGQWREFSNN